MPATAVATSTEEVARGFHHYLERAQHRMHSEPWRGKIVLCLLKPRPAQGALEIGVKFLGCRSVPERGTSFPISYRPSLAVECVCSLPVPWSRAPSTDVAGMPLWWVPGPRPPTWSSLCASWTVVRHGGRGSQPRARAHALSVEDSGSPVFWTHPLAMQSSSALGSALRIRRWMSCQPCPTARVDTAPHGLCVCGGGGSTAIYHP